MSAQSDFELAWATPADEPDIRALVGSVTMPGAIAVRFAREPDYFLGTTIMGDPCDVLVARHRADGRLVGIACRAESRAYVNGQESSLGYIGQIRVAPGFRGHWLVQKGAAWFERGESARPGLHRCHRRGEPPGSRPARRGAATAGNPRRAHIRADLMRNRASTPRPGACARGRSAAGHTGDAHRCRRVPATTRSEAAVLPRVHAR